MILWGFVALLIVLIPLLAIVIDSQVGQALANRISSGQPEEGELRERIDALEGEVRYLTESMESLREETDFVRRLIETREEPRPPRLGEGRGGDGERGAD